MTDWLAEWLNGCLLFVKFVMVYIRFYGLDWTGQGRAGQGKREKAMRNGEMKYIAHDRIAHSFGFSIGFGTGFGIGVGSDFG